MLISNELANYSNFLLLSTKTTHKNDGENIAYIDIYVQYNIIKLKSDIFPLSTSPLIETERYCRSSSTYENLLGNII